MKGSVWGKENPVPGQEAGLCFTLKNVISLPSISPCVPLSWGHPIYDHPIGSSRQPRQRVGALSVPQSPALHIQPPNPHTVLLELFLTMSLIHRKAQDILCFITSASFPVLQSRLHSLLQLIALTTSKGLFL